MSSSVKGTASGRPNQQSARMGGLEEVREMKEEANMTINDSGLGWGIRIRIRAPVLLFTLGGTERDLQDVQASRPGMPVDG